VLLLADTPPGVEFWWDFSKALGFAAISMMGVQFALTARFKRLSAPFGIDVIYLAHRYLAWIALALAASHFAIIWLLYRDAAGPLDPFQAPWYMTAGRFALVCFALAVITSQWRDRLGLAYGTWRLIHILLATLGFAAAVAHILGVGYYTATPLNRALWLSMTLAWLALGIYVRLVKPARQHGHPYRVAEVRDEGADSWTIALEPDGHPGLKRFKPGQFVWLTLGSSPFAVREHPFSISSTPGRLPRVELTVRELGDFTGAIGEHRRGEIAYLDGPHGVFSHENAPDAAGFVFLVGGVGITPVISMLRSMAETGEQRPSWLFYANPDIERFLFRRELEELAERMPLTLIPVLQKPPEGWKGESGYISQEVLLKYLPQKGCAALHYFICGPPPMLAAMQDHLAAIGAPSDHVHLEVFNL
jgi:predicted ferric reductase